MTRRAGGLLLAGAVAVAAGCGDDDPPTGSGLPVALGVEARLAFGVAPFKVDARLDAEFRPAIEGAEPTAVGSIVLPAGSRRSRAEVVVPAFRGTLLVRERTASEAVPFLVGESDPFLPADGLEIEIPLVLCSPPDSVPDEEGVPQLVVDPDCPPEIAD